MATYFISRHNGAIQWAKAQGIKVDKQLTHLNADVIEKDDIVIGTLPVNLIAEVCQRGGRYFHLTLELPAEQRGKELSSDDMQRYNARLEEYNAENVKKKGGGNKDKPD